MQQYLDILNRFANANFRTTTADGIRGRQATPEIPEGVNYLKGDLPG